MSSAHAYEQNAGLSAPWTGVSLTDLFSSTVQMNGSATAVIERYGVAKRALSYREADVIVDGIARHFMDLGLETGQPVIISMHNCLEAPLAILGALRGGFVPCLLPVSATIQQAGSLMRLVKAKAVVTVGAVERLRPADLLRQAAVESGGPRFILAFGSNLPAGTIGLDGVLTRSFDAGERGSSTRDEGYMPGVMTTELQPDGVTVHRHDQEGLVAAALQLVLRSGMAAGDTMLSTLAPMTHAGLACGLVSTLLVGGILQAHPLFSGAELMQQLEESPRSHLVVPGVLEGALAEAKVLGTDMVASTLLVHRPPARFDRDRSGACNADRDHRSPCAG